MIIHIARVSPEGSWFEGEEPGAILDLAQDAFAHEDGPISYRLFAEVVSGELVVRGTLRASVRVLCGRCGGFFSTTLEVSSFLRAYELSGPRDTVDLTPAIREDILLELPSFPGCSWTGEAGTCPFSGVNLDELRREEPPPGDSRWDTLDNLGAG